MGRLSGLCFFGFLILAACNSHPSQQLSTGVAYVGPQTLNLRKDLSSKSAPVGIVKHGERLDVLETRRRFVKVRTAEGVEGWTDSNLLLTPPQMEDLQRLADSTAKLPSEGTATVYEPLNMHTEPNRQSSSFFQVPEGGSVEVIGHHLSPRVPPSAPPRVIPSTRKQVPSKKPKGKETKQTEFLLPLPRLPTPPVHWEELSRPRLTDLAKANRLAANASHPGAEAAAPPAMDDWNLVRMRDGKAGWVLGRMLVMSIPDEVAQYAEGHRITAYVSLGDVKDGTETKHNWLWTTQSTPSQPGEFDSFRVFVWSTRRHRYETAYIERNVKGYFPVEAEARPGQAEKAFSLVLEDKDGRLYQRTYGFAGYHVRMISKVPYQLSAELPKVRESSGFNLTPTPASAGSGWREKLLDWRHWFRSAS
jgi:hypothetical protein